MLVPLLCVVAADRCVTGVLGALAHACWQVSQGPRQEPSCSRLFLHRLQSVGTRHSSSGTLAATNPARLRALGGGSGTLWSMASMRQLPKERCHRVRSPPTLCVRLEIEEIGRRIFSYALRQRLLSPFAYPCSSADAPLAASSGRTGNTTGSTLETSDHELPELPDPSRCRLGPEYGSPRSIKKAARSESAGGRTWSPSNSPGQVSSANSESKA